MTQATTEYKHILLDDKGVATIEGTTMKVVELVTSHITYGWSPEELHFQYPHISLGKIYSALAYYWDCRESLDEEMERRFETVDRLKQQASPSPIAQRLRDRGLMA